MQTFSVCRAAAKGVTHVMIVACYHPLPLSACMLHFDLVSILFGTSIPTSFNILVKMFLYFKYLKMIKNWNFPYVIIYFMYFESIVQYRSTCRDRYVSKKAGL